MLPSEFIEWLNKMVAVIFCLKSFQDFQRIIESDKNTNVLKELLPREYHELWQLFSGFSRILLDGREQNTSELARYTDKNGFIEFCQYYKIKIEDRSQESHRVRFNILYRLSLIFYAVGLFPINNAVNIYPESQMQLIKSVRLRLGIDKANLAEAINSQQQQIDKLQEELAVVKEERNQLQILLKEPPKYGNLQLAPVNDGFDISLIKKGESSLLIEVTDQSG